MNPLSNSEIFGNWATLLLTTDKRGKLDFYHLSDEIDVLIASKPNGIYSNGTAGEFFTQTEDEFMQLGELLAGKCENAKIPFQIGVSHMSPQNSLERLKRIKHLKPGAVQVILPDWFPVTFEESVFFFEKMAEEADGLSLVLYNPPHSKRILEPAEWKVLKEKIPSLMGVKVSDRNANRDWYQSMQKHSSGLSVFIPGHNLATGLSFGAHGAYSNMACLNPFAAQKWFDLTQINMESALELEERIRIFMNTLIKPFILNDHFSDHACDRFMAIVGGWADIGSHVRWPYRSIPEDLSESVRLRAKRIIPEFFIQD